MTTRTRPADPKETKHVRAAVYTRVSTDEKLGQEFNSLDAQREAAEAYIVSQKLIGILIASPPDSGPGWSTFGP